MQPNWVNVYSADQMYKVLLIKEVLSENDIESFIINKRDSIYSFGDIELYVKPEDVIKSLFVIKKSEV